MKYKKSIFVIIVIIMVSAVFYISDKLENKSEKEDISAWVVDWDLEQGLDEVKEYNLSSVQLFAAYFDEDGDLFLPQNLIDIIENKDKIKENNKLYITVVNDIVKNDGSSIQKDSKIIKDILLQKERREYHINQLVKLVCEGGFNGLDLDYEKIDSELWNEYANFIDELGKELKKNKKELRVILEPRSPIDKVNLPKEYEYVMMAYNLYGYHSGPGPKADKEFIKELSKKVNDNLDNARMAFSLGGFDWCEDGKIKALTYVDANNLAKENDSKLNRDKDSGVLYFDYIDSNGKKHSVWYSDNETIRIWKETSKENHINKFALWRLGKSI